MSKVRRVDIDKLTSNEDLFNNMSTTVEFNLDNLPKELEKPKYPTVDFDEYLSTVPDTINILNDGYNKVCDSPEQEFELTQRLNEMQIVILTESMQVLYQRYRESSNPKLLRDIVLISEQLNTAKKSLLDARKDLIKIQSDSIDVGNIVVEEGATLNIQNNYNGTPNDILKNSGDALDDIEFVKYVPEEVK